MVTTFLSLISGINVFDYIDRVHVKMPVFYNFMYSLDLQQTVLRPYCNISDFQIWDYYLAEELRHGPSYDYVRTTHHIFSRILNFLFVFFFSRKKLSFLWKLHPQTRVSSLEDSSVWLKKLSLLHQSVHLSEPSELRNYTQYTSIPQNGSQRGVWGIWKTP